MFPKPSSCALTAAAALAAGLLAVPAAHAVPVPEPHTTIQIPGVGGAVGDINGDGLDDVGAAINARGFVVFGSATKSTIPATGPGARGLTITDPMAKMRELKPAGDVNGDGRGDVLVVRYGGTSTVVFGRPTAGAIDASAPGAGGFLITGAPGDWPRVESLTAAGDVNGDGRDDIAFSAAAEGGTLAGPFGSGVVFGAASSAPVAAFALGGRGFGVVRTGSPGQGGALLRFGDSNGDGRSDLFSTFTTNTGLRFDLVYGRTSTATVDLTNLGTGGLRLTNGAGIAVDTVHGPVGDLDGDGKQDISMTTRAGTSTVALSSRLKPVVSSVTVVNGGLAFRKDDYLRPTATVGTGDIGGDGRDDVAVAAQSYATGAGSFFVGSSIQYGRTWNYLVTGPSAPRLVTLATPPTGVQRLDALPDRQQVIGGLEFDGDPGREILTSAGGSGVVVQDIVERTLPRDTTAPAVTNVTAGPSTITNRVTCPCPAPQVTTLAFTLGEKARLGYVLRRGTTTVGSMSNWVDSGPHQISLAGHYAIGGIAPQIGRLVAGATYTLTVTATDLAGNRLTAAPLSVNVVG